MLTRAGRGGSHWLPARRLRHQGRQVCSKWVEILANVVAGLGAVRDEAHIRSRGVASCFRRCWRPRRSKSSSPAGGAEVDAVRRDPLPSKDCCRVRRPCGWSRRPPSAPHRPIGRGHGRIGPGPTAHGGSRSQQERTRRRGAAGPCCLSPVLEVRCSSMQAMDLAKHYISNAIRQIFAMRAQPHPTTRL